MGGASRNEIVRTVQTDIEHGVSVYDEQFAQQRERFGDAFVHEYLSEVATHMAVHIVRAFEEHDRKRYQRCARSFGTVYVFLFPVSVRAAQTAGTSYALALKHHDVIEDGVHAVVTDDPIVNGSVAADSEVPLPVRVILDHSYWNAVLLCFELVADALELPTAYAEAQTEFFRYHTAVQEARDRSWAGTQYLREVAMGHARRAQQIKFHGFVDDGEALNTIAEWYLAAVRSHDAHTREEQEANIGRMTVLYDQILAAVVDMDPLDRRISEEVARRIQR